MPRITELWAWVLEDTGPDDEGVPAMLGADGFWQPMIGADRDRALSLREQALWAAQARGKPIRLVRSTGLELVETITPS